MSVIILFDESQEDIIGVFSNEASAVKRAGEINERHTCYDAGEGTKLLPAPATVDIGPWKSGTCSFYVSKSFIDPDGIEDTFTERFIMKEYAVSA